MSESKLLKLEREHERLCKEYADAVDKVVDMESYMKATAIRELIGMTEAEIKMEILFGAKKP